MLLIYPQIPGLFFYVTGREWTVTPCRLCMCTPSQRPLCLYICVDIYDI